MARFLCRLFGHRWQVRIVRNKRVIVWRCARCGDKAEYFRSTETIPFITPHRWRG